MTGIQTATLIINGITIALIAVSFYYTRRANQRMNEIDRTRQGYFTTRNVLVQEGR